MRKLHACDGLSRALANVTHLMLGTDLLPLVLVTSLEGVPVTLAVATPGVVAQRANEDWLSAQHNSHSLHGKTFAVTLSVQ